MSIELHCPQCEKLIRAPDHAGGKQGKCPYCKNKVYIPLPADEIEVIPIAPIDAEEERLDQEARRDSIRYATTVAHGRGGGTASETDSSSVRSSNRAVEVSKEVATYVGAMHQSKLDATEAALARLRRVKDDARTHIEAILAGKSRSEFAGIPAPLAQAFLKKLIAELN